MRYTRHESGSEMRRVISALASKHGVDLTADRVVLSLHQPGGGLLCIHNRYQTRLKSDPMKEHVDKRSTRNFLLISKPYSSNLDEENLYPTLHAVAFLTIHGDWIPFEAWWYRQFYRVAEPRPDGDGFVQVDEVGQADLADWTEKWAREIEDHWQLLEHGEKVEWLENGVRVERVWDDVQHWYSNKVLRPPVIRFVQSE